MDEIIQVQGLCKTFQVLKRQPGWSGALRNLFHPGYRLVEAVKQVSFGLKPGRTSRLPGAEWSRKIHYA